jgi:glycosyltransferase involved in cell wall biosynthesis
MKLSIITTTYNSEKFIERTVERVLGQKTDFEYEYIISDDGSSDKTVEIVQNIQKIHPKGYRIRLIRLKENQGVMKNFFGAVKETQGEYIAFCDSDDLWNDDQKLETQVEYLDKHPNCTVVYHSTINLFESNIDKKGLIKYSNKVNKVMRTPQTSTLVVRGILRDLINEQVVNEAPSINDQYLRFLLRDLGTADFIPKIIPNSRIIRLGSIFSTLDDLERAKIALKSWSTFYKYHGSGKNEKFLKRKVNGFSSRVHWAEYGNSKNLNTFLKALHFDMINKIMFKRIVKSIRKILFYPYRAFKLHSL